MEKGYQQSQIVKEQALIKEIKSFAKPFTDTYSFDNLMDHIGDAKIVLLGQSTHGSHESLLWQATLSKKLIDEKNFSFVAFEGDWPDFFQLNRFIKGLGKKEDSIHKILKQFNRWPTWMWGNWEIQAFLEWLQFRNLNKPLNEKVGVYGIDIYSLRESLVSIMDYLKKTDPVAYLAAQNAAACFHPYDYEGIDYANQQRLAPISCEKEVIALLKQIVSNLVHYNTDPESVLSADQNAYLIFNSEKYYRELLKGNNKSWNLRENHMYSTLERLMNYHGKDAKAIVWSHNSHIGNPRATNMHFRGLTNIEELMTLKYGEENVYKIGSGIYEGRFLASTDWKGSTHSMTLPPAISGSWEYLLHKSLSKDFYLITEQWLQNPLFMELLGHRSIGLIYHPNKEGFSNYEPTLIPLRYDAFVFLDKTEAISPLGTDLDEQQAPETFPWGI